MLKKTMKITILIISGALFSLFFIPLPMYGVFNAGNIAGMLFFGALFLCAFYSKKLFPAVKEVVKKPWGKAAAVGLAVLLAAGTAAAVFSGTKIIKSALNAPLPGRESTVVVLGCRVYDSGPSRMLLSRIGAAESFLKENPDAVCILSGGQGDDEPIAEAACMFEELTRRGVSPERLIIEDRSESTRENLAFSLEIIKEKRLPEDLTLVTNEYHQCRASMIAESLGCKAYAVSAPSQRILLPTYFVREIFGVLFETVKRTLIHA